MAILTQREKVRRTSISPSEAMADEVALMVLEETPSGAVLGSDYAEHRVNQRAFRLLSGGGAAMLIADARLCGLEDGAT